LSEIEQELKGQYLGTLLGFIKEASMIAYSTNSNYLQNYWRAVEFYEDQIIPFCIPYSEEDEKVFDSFLEEINSVRKESYKIIGETKEFTMFYRQAFLSKRGKIIYGRLLMAIQRQLRDQGYYSFLKGGKSGLWDTSRGRKSGGFKK